MLKLEYDPALSPPTKEEEERALQELNWFSEGWQPTQPADLALIKHTLQKLLSNYQRMKERIKELERIVKIKEAVIEDRDITYAEQISELEAENERLKEDDYLILDNHKGVIFKRSECDEEMLKHFNTRYLPVRFARD